MQCWSGSEYHSQLFSQPFWHQRAGLIAICSSRLHTYIHTYIHTLVVHTYMYVHTCIHTYIHTHTHIHLHTFSTYCIFIFTCIHTCVHTYIHLYTFSAYCSFIHTYIHVRTTHLFEHGGEGSFEDLQSCSKIFPSDSHPEEHTGI